MFSGLRHAASHHPDTGTDLRKALGDPQRYRDQIDRLHVKYSQRKQLYDLYQDGVSLASLSFDRGKVARMLAETVSAGSYKLRPAQLREIAIGDKRRVLYSFCLTDRIVHGAVSSIISDVMNPLLSPRLYSYRKGYDWWKAVSAFANYVREHRRKHPDPKDRGLYVLRRDVYKYTDSIPVHGQSEVWPLIQRVLSLDRRRGRGSMYWPLIEEIVRPTIQSDDGSMYQNVRGVPTGSPISTVLFNLYLVELDTVMSDIPGGFYARYSDDILFAHPDAQVTELAGELIDRVLARKGLQTNRTKDQNFYFNGAGRSSPHSPAFRGTHQVSFLGCRVFFKATVSLSAKKSRRLLKEVSARTRDTLAALDGSEAAVAGPVLCAVVNKFLDPRATGRHNSAALLRNAVTDRDQLLQLDYQIALILSQAIAGESGARAFRNIPYRVLRREWALISLAYTRNSSHRRGPRP